MCILPRMPPKVDVTPDQAPALQAVFNSIRRRGPIGRSDIARDVELGRAVVGERVKQLIALGLVRERGPGASKGGRRAVELEIRAEAGLILSVDLGFSHSAVAIANVAGEILAFKQWPSDIASGPDEVLPTVVAGLESLLLDVGGGGKVWGIGVSLPTPLEFATASIPHVQHMALWEGFAIRDYFQNRFDASTWVDKDANVMALAEARVGATVDAENSMFVKIGTGIGLGLISSGRLHRGAQGSAGEISHVPFSADESLVCDCGNTGCLALYASSTAISRQATALAESGRSQVFGEILQSHGRIEARDVIEAARKGDPEALAFVTDSGRNLGRALAGMVNLFNPETIVVGGSIAMTGGHYLAAIRESIYKRALPLATRDLKILMPSAGARTEVIGCVHLVLDELTDLAVFRQWISRGTAAGFRAN